MRPSEVAGLGGCEPVCLGGPGGAQGMHTEMAKLEGTPATALDRPAPLARVRAGSARLCTHASASHSPLKRAPSANLHTPQPCRLSPAQSPAGARASPEWKVYQLYRMHAYVPMPLPSHIFCSACQTNGVFQKRYSFWSVPRALVPCPCRDASIFYCENSR